MILGEGRRVPPEASVLVGEIGALDRSWLCSDGILRLATPSPRIHKDELLTGFEAPEVFMAGFEV